MGMYVYVTIKITKGDPKEVLNVVRTKESVIDLSTFVTGKHHRHPEFAKHLGELEAEYSTEDVTVIRFSVKWTPDAIFDELAERFSKHEFIVIRDFELRDFEQYGEDELVLKNGQCKLVYSRQWGWSEKRQQTMVIRDMKWDWDGTEQEGSFDIREEFVRQEKEWYDQQHPEFAACKHGIEEYPIFWGSWVGSMVNGKKLSF